MSSVEYVLARELAVDSVRSILRNNEVTIVQERTINKGAGLKFSCLLGGSSFGLVLYFKADLSSRIVFENAPDSVRGLFERPCAETESTFPAIPIHASLRVMDVNQRDVIRERVRAAFTNTEETVPAPNIQFRLQIRQRQYRFTVTQFHSGTLLLQGTSSPVFDRVKEIIQSVKPLSELENALLFVPEEEKAAVEAKLAENPQAFPHLQSKAEERVSKEAFEFLYSHDKEMLMSAIHILEALRSSNLHMPLYNPIIFPFARVFEGFIIRLMVEKRFFTLQQFRENPDIARIGNALRQRKFEKYIKDPVRNSRVLDKLTTIWEDLRCHELHSDPVQNPGIVGLRDITQVENRIGEISSAIMDGYRVLVKHGYTEEEMLANRGGRSPSDVSAKPSDPSEQGRTIDAMPLYESRIGTDESGKGDYFGPLVIAGVFLASEMEDKLERIGIRDSKKNSDARNRQLASEIKKLLGKDSYNVVCISPEKYNELYTKMKNLNTLLAWGHARVIENILSKVSCAIAIADQFGSEDYIKKALMERGKTINLLQTPKAERDMAVAAASILARDMFLQQIDQLEVGCGMSLPKGASPAVEEAARLLIEKSGNQSLGRYAKLHFKTTEKVRK